MGIFLYWWLGTFLYFKIAISAADFHEENLTVLSSFLLATIFCLTLLSITKSYAEKLVICEPEIKDKISKIIKLTLGIILRALILFGILSRLIVFGFSGELSRKVHYREENEILLMVILLLPLLLHYAMVIFSSLNLKSSQNQTKKDSKPQSNMNSIIFKNNQSAFEYACKFMNCKLEKGAKIPALVVDIVDKAKFESTDIGQDIILKVASKDGGFLIIQNLFGHNETSKLSQIDIQNIHKNIGDLKVGDFVLWQATFYYFSEDNKQKVRDDGFASLFPANHKMISDSRFGWNGMVIANLEPHFDIKNGWKISKDDGSGSFRQP